MLVPCNTADKGKQRYLTMMKKMMLMMMVMRQIRMPAEGTKALPLMPFSSSTDSREEQVA